MSYVSEFTPADIRIGGAKPSMVTIFFLCVRLLFYLCAFDEFEGHPDLGECSNDNNDSEYEGGSDETPS